MPMLLILEQQLDCHKTFNLWGTCWQA